MFTIERQSNNMKANKETSTAIVRTSPDITTLTENFINSQDVKPSSRALYKRTLRQYFNWIAVKGYELKDITRIELLGYKDEMLNSGLSTLTVGSYLTVVRKFYEWTEANKFYPNIAKGIKTPKRSSGFKKDPLTIDQIKGLLNFIDTTTLSGKRDFAILNLLVRTGLRTVEVARANIEDIQHKAGEIVLIIQGKGRDSKDNFVLLTHKTAEPIYAYLEARGKAKATEPLFCSGSNNSKGERLTTRTISYIAKSNLKGIGLNSGRLTAHSLRHTAGVNVLRAGGDLYATQLFMRHSDPATTQIYLRSIEEEVRLKSAPEKLIDAMF